MGEIKKFQKHKLITGVLSSLPGRKNEILKVLSEEFGEIDFVSQELLFKYTDYYNNEMGDVITRFFVSFGEPVDPVTLSDIKIRTNYLEKLFCTQEKENIFHRKVNFDPGLLSSSRLILASTKDFSHRIPLKDGIFAEITLIFRGGIFEPLPWTFPDYRSEEYLKILMQIREKIRKN